MGAASSPPGWYPDPSGAAGRRYWDGTSWHSAIPAPAKPPGRVNWPLLISVAGGLVLVLIVVSAVFGGSSAKDDAYIRALTTGGGMRAHPNWVASRDRDDLIAAGQYYCDRIKAGDGLIQASKVTMDRFHLPPGSSGIMGVSHAAGEVYCPALG